MKKFDVVIIISFIIISIISAVWFMVSSNKQSQNKYAEIYVEGTLYKRIKLTKDMQETTFTIKTNLGTNVVNISDGKIRMLDSNCHDKVCVRSGFIDKIGETIVCLPHKIVIEIKGEGKRQTDDLAY